MEGFSVEQNIENKLDMGALFTAGLFLKNVLMLSENIARGVDGAALCMMRNTKI